MRRNKIKALLACSAIAGAIACNDNGLSPDAATGRSVAAVSSADESRDADKHVDFDITTAGGEYQVGPFTISIPENAVCDLSSPYGPPHWDEACALAGETVHVRAKVFSKGGRSYVDFKPALRFSPSANVIISTDVLSDLLAGHVEFTTHASALTHLGILYSADIGRESIDEATVLRDASLITNVDLVTGRVWRRIKHFSGYNIASGLECVVSDLDPDCIDSPINPGPR
jgi:hypothetical protein